MTPQHLMSTTLFFLMLWLSNKLTCTSLQSSWPATLSSTQVDQEKTFKVGFGFKSVHIQCHRFVQQPICIKKLGLYQTLKSTGYKMVQVTNILHPIQPRTKPDGAVGCIIDFVYGDEHRVHLSLQYLVQVKTQVDQILGSRVGTHSRDLRFARRRSGHSGKWE